MAKFINNGKTPSVGDAVTKINSFARLLCAQEAIARNGAGGIVRIEALAPVLEAIDQYVSQLPITTIEG
ncbi:hypothetical protein N5D52_27340 [Pseudomonas sp. GD03860]|uniref:hypothetical protein n=1 Tax=Pseudomonas sp. GD03860 TaxID=2975389 RepID=UPI002449AB3E|nr:hypothetical protein [Pseudomonas sp. GD03860]MDH0640643.1 hypothetical protein [Pseudomonas sp. GD03860]